MPDQHRAFFAQLPFLVAGAVDGQGDPWAGVLEGEPGFAVSPDPQTLQVAALPDADDPLRAGLGPDQPVGLLGIELHTRRRNRMNGRITAWDGRRFAVTVAESATARSTSRRAISISRARRPCVFRGRRASGPVWPTPTGR